MAAEEIIFKISADTKDALKNTDALEKELEAVNESALQVIKANSHLSKSFEEVYGDMQPLSTRLGELEDRMYELALAGEQNTREFKELQAEAVRYRQVLISVDKSVDQLAEQGRGLGAALQLGTAVTAGYGALQGSMVALGMENESLEKSFVKLQAIQTVLASLEQLKLALDKQSILVTKAKAIATGLMSAAQLVWTTATAGTTVAMGALRIAMLAIPLVAIIAGIAALVGWIYSLMSATEDLEAANDKLTTSINNQRTAMELSNAAIAKTTENRIKLAKAQGASLEEIHQMELDQLKEIEQARIKDKNLANKEYYEKRKLMIKAAQQGDAELQKQFKSEMDEATKRYYELKIQDKDYYYARETLIAEHNKKITEEQKKSSDKQNSNARQAAQERARQEEEERRTALERDRLFRDLMIENIEDEDVRKMTKLKESHRRERDEIIAKHGEDTMLLQQLATKQITEEAKLMDELAAAKKEAQANIDRQAEEERQKQLDRERRNERAEIEGKLIAMRDDFAAEMMLKRELAEIEMTQALTQADLTEGEIFKIKEEYKQKIADLDAQEAQRKVDIEKQTADAVKGIYESSFSAISTLADGIFAVRIANAEDGSKKELELQKKAFEFNKGMQVANATIQGIQAVQSTFATAAASPYGVLNPWYAYAQASAAGAAALGNILKIKATTFQGGGSMGSTSVSPPSTAIPTSTEPEDDTTTLTNGLPNNQNGNISVTVVDSDISGALTKAEKVKVISSIR